ncbi:MAG: AtpZ/AtpI family protein [Chloroflexota bacterium]|jgi:predicted F0F1-ATPase subunit|nr:AtpZ/AtpI family protein [Chloroflexota bacterium]
MTLNEKNNKRSWIKDFNLISLGWELALPIFGGVFLGYQIDQYLDSQYTFTLICLILGITAGYYNLYRLIELEVLRTKTAKLNKKREGPET